MEKQFIPYEFALKLKEFGFDELCLKRFYINKKLMKLENASELCLHTSFFVNDNTQECISSPTWEQVFDWFSDLDIDKNVWPIESWIQPYLSDQPRQYEAFYNQRGYTVSVGRFNTKQEAIKWLDTINEEITA